MIDQTEFNILISNILNGKRRSHCRLCLKKIKKHYVKFGDMVCLDNNTKDTTKAFAPISEVLIKLLGENVCDEIPGIDALCLTCVESAFQAAKFIEAAHNSSKILNEVFNNLTKTCSKDILTTENQVMYITIEDLETNVIVAKAPFVRTESDKNCEFKCRKCRVCFEACSELKAHNLTRHGTFMCEKCCDIFMTDEELQIHEDSYHEFECPECFIGWGSEESLQLHQDRAHNVHVCKECGKSCIGLDKLHLHECKHSEKNICSKCGKTYTTKEFYLKHIELCLKDMIDPHPIRSNYERNYTCKKCDKSYSTPGGLRVHNRFVHENAKPHVCEECGKKFTAPSYLKIHMVTHTGEKNYKCNICTSRFVSKEALLYHTRRHTGEKPYSCKICNEKFVNASSRAEHIKFRHVGPMLMCEICSRKFVTSHFLRQHISRHHDPSSKLYYGRNMIPPNMPGEQNMRFKTEIEN